ncbi:MAG TPA: SGNH/GDSL hydrolase family protein [Phycisphaerae bacterium]|nr:SGNH/GDSL hydrolase family protein [Phycisphaerae bacterium]
MTTRPSEDGKWVWHEAAELTIEGKGWLDTERPFDRLPARAKNLVREPVWNLSRNSAGLCIHFIADAPAIAARWTLTSNNLSMAHMPATGMSGLDLYVREDLGWPNIQVDPRRGPSWKWIGAGRPSARTNEATLVAHMPATTHEFLLYLPLYNGVESLQIGVPPGYGIARLVPRRDKPVVFYGTSITQGGCASRPGMAYPAILGRRLNRATINLGFSGNGRMDPELADLLGEIDAAGYVLDCLPNMKMDMIAERVEPFILALRRHRPTTPIILVESVTYPAQRFVADPATSCFAQNRLLRRIYDRLTARGVAGLHYMPGTGLYGNDGEATVDGCHATDLGFLRFADGLEPLLRQVLIDRAHRELSVEEIERVAGKYHKWRSKDKKGYEDVAGFCKGVNVDEIRQHGHVLTPGRYVGAEDVEDDGEPFSEKMSRLVSTLGEHFKESARLEKVIWSDLKELGYDQG